MFRKPRDQAIPVPSVGRPPSPPGTPSPPKSTPLPLPKPMAGKTPKSKASQNKISSFFGKVSAAQAQAQRQEKRTNESILKFFQKVDAPAHFERDLFVGGANDDGEIEETDDTTLDDQENRYNETVGSVKRRRLDGGASEILARDSASNKMIGLETPNKTPEIATGVEERAVNANPFAEDSDSEDDATAEDIQETNHKGQDITEPDKIDSPEALDSSNNSSVKTEEIQADPSIQAPTTQPIDDQPDETLVKTEEEIPRPALLRKDTSWVTNDEMDEFGDFDADEFYENGEEYIERRYMEEQAQLEREFENDGTAPPVKQEEYEAEEEATNSDTSCPICSSNLGALSVQEISIHVNGCLDGKPVPLPMKTETPLKTETEEKSILATAKRFQRSAIPRPGQANPSSLASTGAGGSAFSKLMSSHAEDEAWAIAAANEMAARGKPAFKRTCPFYKILPGFFTCVDAFRYGAVEGCNAYFLSHFHSDHYIGLTSTWCHGPIYCSKVTGNLVRQQLRVDPKWVVDLEWEKKTEVPRTEGLFVTMISANHCPGSSIFLFEKVMTKGTGNSRLQRVLHCGDFRACPAHVQHPLLRPDVMDSVTGHNRQQKLDVCYLDTTYLTPKYAFPSQESVIKACADMCVSLSKDQVDELDTWERTKKARAGTGMVKFVQKEAAQADDGPEAKGRGRLLVVCGTYSIGKERICVGIARALNSKIFAPAGKRRICLALEDPELASLLTDDPYDAQIHMQMLMEIRPETLADYLTEYKPHFSRIVGFRPTGWSYRPPNSRFVESPLVQTVLNSDNWKTSFSMAELMPQRGSTRESNCFGVPYSEHSSFRELTMFCCALRIDKIIPTVNIGSAKSREKMKGWIEKWNNDKKKNGLYKVADDATSW